MKNKDADQLHGNHTNDQRLCFHFLPKSKIPSLLLSSVDVEPGFINGSFISHADSSFGMTKGAVAKLEGRQLERK